MARRIRDPESRRRLVHAAWRLVARQGVAPTSVRAIATEAGVSTGSVTHYFEDKAEVMTAVLRYNNKLAAQRISEPAPEARGLDLVERTTRALLPLDEERLAMWTVWIAFWGSRLAHQETAREGQQSGYGALLAFLVHAFDDAVDLGELASETDTQYEAERILVLLGGLGLMSGGEQRLIDEVSARTDRMLTEHLTSLRQASPAGTA